MQRVNVSIKLFHTVDFSPSHFPGFRCGHEGSRRAVRIELCRMLGREKGKSHPPRENTEEKEAKKKQKTAFHPDRKLWRKRNFGSQILEVLVRMERPCGGLWLVWAQINFTLPVSFRVVFEI